MTIHQFPQRPAGGGSDLAGPSEPPHDGGMETRVAALESDMKYVRRDLDEVRGDVRAIKDKVFAIDSTLNSISLKIDACPTKLQMAVWASAGLIALLGVATALIALLLRVSGHPEAAGAVDAIRGK